MTRKNAFSSIALLVPLLCPTFSHAELIGHWTFDNTVANNKPIAGAVNGDGTIHGGATYDTSDSKVGGASLQFNGSDGFVDIGVIPEDHPLQLSGGELSFSVWIRDNESPSVARIFDKAEQGFARHGYALWLSSEQLTYRTGAQAPFDNPNGLFRTSGGAIPTDVWRHVVYSMSRDAVTEDVVARAYINGVEDVLATANNNPIPVNSAAPLKFGIGGDVLNAVAGSTAGAYFSGHLDDLGLWDDMLSPGEAISLYNLSESDLDYDQLAAEQLIDLHRSGAGSVQVGDVTWSYATGLAGDDGQVAKIGGAYSVVFDAAAGTGLTSSQVIPEPTTVCLAGLLVGLFVAKRRVRS